MPIKAGDKFNKLTAVEFSHRDKNYKQYWLFLCECGNKKVINVNNVKRGLTKACGCMEHKGNRFIHGMKGTKIYRCWENMKKRCLNKNSPDYHNYGGRGITICKKWMDFKNFFADMKFSPTNKSLDRIDNNGNYELNNCKWSTQKEQCNNKRNNIFNKLTKKL